MQAMKRAQQLYDAALNWAGRRNLLRPLAHGAHPIFDAYPPRAAQGDGVQADYLGNQTQAHMMPQGSQLGHNGVPPPPPIDEEYFEWIDVLETVRAAGERFTMLELGAGYGRWALRGWKAAKRLGKSARIVLVEAEPQHLEWARSHLAFNGVPEDDVCMVDAAIAVKAGTTTFIVEMPAGSQGNNARDWYGQALSWVKPVDGVAAQETYCGRPLLALEGGWKGIEVATLPLSALLDGEDFVDLIDLDIQGAEDTAIAAAIEPLTAKVRRLHIGTHGRAIEKNLHCTLRGAGWVLVRSYACQRWNRTPFGWVNFGDGVQTWINPRLTP